MSVIKVLSFQYPVFNILEKSIIAGLHFFFFFGESAFTLKGMSSLSLVRYIYIELNKSCMCVMNRRIAQGAHIPHWGPLCALGDQRIN